MSKRELNPWDRFWLYVKENEKVIWVLLLLLLAPSFAFTGYFATWMQTSARASAVATIHGKNITRSDFEHAQRSILLVQEVVPEYFGEGRLYGPDLSGIVDYHIYLREADRLGIRVSDYELGSEIRRIYRFMVAREEADKAVLNFLRNQKDSTKEIPQQALMNLRQQTFFSKVNELGKDDVFNQRDWYERLQNFRSQNWHGPVPREDFESALRAVMKTYKVVDYMRKTVQVSSDEVLEEYKRKEQSRKFTFFEVNANAAKEEVEKAISEADIQARYKDRKDDFKDSLKIRVEYLSVPVAEFEKRVTLTDEDLRKEYDRVKMQKYQTFVEGETGGFELLSAEERAEREKKAFRPFEEVKEEIHADLTKVRVREAARASAEEIQGKLFPKKPGAVGEKKEEPAPATFAEIAMAYPMVKTGTTPWVGRMSAEKDMGPAAYSSLVNSWIIQLEPSASNKTPKKEIDPPKSYTPSPYSEPQHFIFYKKPEVRQPGVPPLAEVKEKVKETLVKEKLLERAKEKAKALAEAVRDGKKSFEEAAKEAGSSPIATAFLEKHETIKVPLSAEEAKAAEAEKKEGEAEVSKEKDFPGSRAILDHGFDSIREKGKVEGFAEDPENSACYIVRWDDAIFPDLKDFDKKRSQYEYTLLTEKQKTYIADWWQKVRAEANPQSVYYGERKAREIPEPEPFE